MDIVKVSWIGGKDSTAAGLLHLREGHYTKRFLKRRKHERCFNFNSSKMV